MAVVRRGLLTQGNAKLGEGPHAWSLPAVSTCPGRSEGCSHCYATQHRYRFPAVVERLAWNLLQARRPDFPSRMTREIRRKGCLAVRVHASGDFFSAAYESAWEQVFAACPRVRFWAYTRSHRVPDVWAVMREWVRFDSLRLWLSADRFMGLPHEVPTGAKVAWLQTDADEEIPPVDLVFRIKRLRGSPSRIGLRTLPVCPNELDGGKRSDEVTCGSCQRCLR